MKQSHIKILRLILAFILPQLNVSSLYNLVKEINVSIAEYLLDTLHFDDVCIAPKGER